MSMSSLFEELAQSFPLENVQPYGEVLVIPVKAFREEWKPRLESEGVQIYSNAYHGQTCFFLRKKMQNQTVSEAEKPQNIEAITQLIREGLGFKEIRERLGLTHAQLMGYLSNLKRRGVLDKIGWISERRMRKPSTREAKNESTKPSLNASNLPLREMLEASLMLLDSHPKVVRFLLQKCMESLP